VIAFEDVPYILGVTPKPSSQDRKISFSIGSCSACGLVHHNHEISGDMYSEIHSHAVGKVWEDHRKAFIGFVGRSQATLGRVLEIGPSSSPMARGLEAASVAYVDFMAEPPFELRSTERYHSGYFPHAELTTQKFDTIIASHVLEHAPKLGDFFANMVGCLSESGTLCLSIPDFEQWIGQRFWNAFSLEHVTYAVESQITWLAAKWNLAYSIERFADHSIFIRFRRGESKAAAADTSLWKDKALPWQEYVNAQIASFERSAAASPSLPVYLTGASHLAQYVLNMSEPLKARCAGVFDNAKSKHGQRLYGTDVMVHSFDDLATLGEVVVIVPASPYQAEIVEQIRGINAIAHVVSA
jgi:SAM-dependent methyltransferase